MASSTSSGGKRMYVQPPASYFDMSPEQKKEFARELVDQLTADRPGTGSTPPAEPGDTAKK